MSESLEGVEKIFLSVVIPAYNEENNIELINNGLLEVLKRMNKTFEIIYIDDGSTDGTWKKIRQSGELDGRVSGIRLRRNFGQAAALSAGFSRARGEVVVSMDCDCQNDPEDIPSLLEKMSNGSIDPGESGSDEGEIYDVVAGWRKDRKDNLFTRRIPSWLANRLIALLTGLKLHDFGCTLRAYRREILEDINLYGEMHRMIPVLAHWMGARIGEIEVRHRAREHGESKYNISRTLNVVLDLITLKFFIGYFTRPLHFFGLLGAFCLLLGFLAFIALVLMKLIGEVNMTGNPFLSLGVLLSIIGVQLVMLGLLGEINIRVYFESQKKPIYTVRESF